MRDVCNQLATAMVEKTDSIIMQELSARLGHPVDASQLAEFAGRIHRKIYPDKVEVFELDGVPFLEMHPIEVRMDRMMLVAEQKYRPLKGRE